MARFGMYFEGRGFVVGLDVSCSRNRGVKDDCKILNQSLRKKTLPFTKMGWIRRNCFGGEFWSSVLDMFQVPIGNPTGYVIKSKGVLLLFLLEKCKKLKVPHSHFPHPSLEMEELFVVWWHPAQLCARGHVCPWICVT